MKTKTLKQSMLATASLLSAIFTGVVGRADYPSTVLSYSPLAYWRLNETAPAPAAPVAVNAGSLGAADNGFGVLDVRSGFPGIVGNSYRFTNNGPTVAYAGSKVDVPWSAALNPQGSFSVEFWAMPAELTTDLFCPISSLDGDGGYRFGWLFYQDGAGGANAWEFRMGAGSGYSATVLSANGTVQANKWQHLVAVYDGVASTVALYLNGQIAAGPKATSAPYQANGYSPVGNGTGRALRFGATGLTGTGGVIAGNRGFDGWLDEVAIYTNTLTAAQVAAHYNAALTNNSGYKSVVLADGPAGYWGLDEPAYTPPSTNSYPVAANLGSLGSAADLKYTPGAIAGVPGPGYSGLGSTAAAVALNGAAGSVGGAGNALDVTGPVTLLAWVKPSLNDNFRDIISHDDVSGANTSAVYLRINGLTNSAGITYEVGSWDGNDYNATAVMPDGDIGNWVFLAGTYDGNGAWNLYRYDTLVASNPTSSGSLSVAADWSIGSGGDPLPLDGRFFGGDVADVAVFDKALTGDQIAAIYYSSLPLPVITVAPQAPSGPVFQGSAIDLSVWASGAGPLSYQWTKNGSALPGQTATNLYLSNLQVSDSGLYSVVVGNANGSVTSSVALSVIGGPPFFNSQPNAATRFAGASATFAVNAGGSTPLSYQWYLGSQLIPGATANSYTVSNIQSSLAGAYYCAVRNPFGSTNSASATLTVLPDPAGYASVVIGDKPIAYYRLDESSGSVAHDFLGGHDGQYFDVVLGLPGFSVSDTDTAVGFGGSGSHVGNIDGAGINFTGGSVGFSLEAWVKGDANQLQGAGGSGGPGIICKGTGINGGSGDEQFDLYIDTAGNFGFYVREASDNAVEEVDATVGPDGAWHHLVAVYDGSEQITAIYVDGVQNNTGAAPASGPRLSSHPVSIGGRQSGVDPTYDLAFNGVIDEVAIYNYPLSAAQVLTHFTSEYGLNQRPLIEKAPVAVTNYAGLSATFSVSVAATPPVSYQWSKDGTPVSGANSASLTISPLIAANAGNYTVLVSNAIGSTNSAPVPLVVLPVPSKPLTIPGLVLHLPFDGNLNDTSGRGNNGKSVGAVTYVPGQVGGQAVSYYTDATVPTNASYNYITLGAPTDLLFSSNVDFSVSFWVQLPPNYAGGDLPFIGNVTNSTFGFGWTLVPTFGPATANWPGGWAFSIFDGAGAGVGVYGDQGSINDGGWHHLVYVFSRAMGEVTYLDGVVAHPNPQSGTTAAAAGNIDTGGAINIGQDPTGQYQPAAEYDAANLDDLGVWRVALTPLQAAGLYVTGAAGLPIGNDPILSIGSASGSGLILTYSNGVLQSGPTVNGPFTTVTGAVSPYSAPTTGGGQVFYRVLQQ